MSISETILSRKNMLRGTPRGTPGGHLGLEKRRYFAVFTRNYHGIFEHKKVPRSLILRASAGLLFWQGHKDSNSGHAVLETAALPAELYPYFKCSIIITHSSGLCKMIFEKSIIKYYFLLFYFRPSIEKSKAIWYNYYRLTYPTLRFV